MTFRAKIAARVSPVLPALAAAALLALAGGPAWAEGDVAKGEKVYKKCKTCHSLEAGKKKVGPHLAGVIGRAAGAVEGFKYSSAMADSGLVWDEATLDSFLEKPKKLIPKNKMAFPGLKKEADRKNVIAYIKSVAE